MINIGMITAQDLIMACFESEKENLIDNNRFIVYNTFITATRSLPRFEVLAKLRNDEKLYR